MRRAVLVSLLLMLGLIGSLTTSTQAQQTSPTQPEVVFPGDAKFSELESQFQEKTKISGAAWAEEFKKRQVFGQVRTNNGIQGTLFTESLALVALLAGQVPYIVYGTITIPQGAKLAQRDFSGNYGIVVIANPFVAALLDVTSGNIGSFVVLPAPATTLPFFPLATPLLSPLGVFQVLVALITVPTPAPPAPPAPPSPQPPQLTAPTCPQPELPNKSAVSLPLQAPGTIATIKDDAGADLFTIGAAPPGALIVQSFAQSLQLRYITTFQQRLGIIIGPGTQQIPLVLDLPFVLFVTSSGKSACLQATPKLVNGVPTVVGTISTN